MKRIVCVALAAILTLSLSFAGKSSALDTNNFRISSYAIAYELSRSSDNRSQLKTTEDITAEFPSYDQNHGIERAIPTVYDNHPTNVTINSVTDGNGTALPYSINSGSGVEVVRIGKADTYVHGSQTYRLTYTQQDVTKFYQDTGRDEWYWDTNGTEWRVPIDTLSISLEVDPSLEAARVGDAQCYVGATGSTTPCTVSGVDGTYSATAQALQPGDNMTVALGFKQGTFAAYHASFWEQAKAIWVRLQVLSGTLSFILVLIIGAIARAKYYRTAETKIIVPEYIPPRDASVVIAAQVVPNYASTAFSAQLIDLAVRHYIAIIETREKSMFKQAEYDIQVITDITPLHAEEKEILSDMFDHTPAVGERIALSSLTRNMAYVGRTTDNIKKVRDLVNDTYKLREKSPEISNYFIRWGVVLLIFAVLLLSVGLLVASIIAFVIGNVMRPLNDKGIELRRYVLGLYKYIKASETERLKFLQGPDTAEKVGFALDTNDPGQLVKLYERTLPYAVLFRLEKQWSQRLGEFYQTSQTTPDWYIGHSAFNAALFSASIANFSQASVQAAGYSAGSSSSSGGSGGGGFSGGGGGGGGGGGW